MNVPFENCVEVETAPKNTSRADVEVEKEVFKMSRLSPLLLLALVSFVASAEAAYDKHLKMVCDPTGNPDLARLEIRETDLAGQLFFSEVGINGMHTNIYSMFGWNDILTNHMPVISKLRTVERLVHADKSVAWTIGGKAAICVDGDYYQTHVAHPSTQPPAVPGLIAECVTSAYTDLVKVEIHEQLDLSGQYYLVEYFADGRKNTIYQFFDASSLKPEDQKTEAQRVATAFPRLTDWYGYTRTLHRDSEEMWSIYTADECSGFSTPLSCTLY